MSLPRGIKWVVLVSVSTLNPILCIHTHMTSSLRQLELYSINRFSVCADVAQKLTAADSQTCISMLPSEKMNRVEKTENMGVCVFICLFTLSALCRTCINRFRKGGCQHNESAKLKGYTVGTQM